MVLESKSIHLDCYLEYQLKLCLSGCQMQAILVLFSGVPNTEVVSRHEPVAQDKSYKWPIQSLNKIETQIYKVLRIYAL